MNLPPPPRSPLHSLPHFARRPHAFAGTVCIMIVLGSLLIGCARPKYYNQPSAPTAPEAPTEKSQRDDQLMCMARFQHRDLCVNYTWKRLPTETSTGEFLIKMFRSNLADGSALIVDPPGALTLSVELWMPSMGHGSSPVKVSTLDIGTFRASEVFFIMKGEWEIRFNLKQGNTLVDQATAPMVVQ